MARIPAILLALTLPATTALGQTDVPAADRDRYQLTRVEGGYLRLDLRSGQVSFCSRRETGWSCLTSADDRAALEQEIGRLQNENVTLKRELLARGLPLPGGLGPAEPGAKGSEQGSEKGSEGSLEPPSHAEIDRMMSTVERIWRRLLQMIGRLQKETLEKT